MSKKTIVRFTKAWRSYFIGDVAGFDKDTAEALIGGGVATSYSSLDPSAAQVVKDPQAASQPKGGKDKQANRRGGSSKPDPVAQTAPSLLSESPTSPVDSSGPASESDPLKKSEDEDGSHDPEDGAGDSEKTDSEDPDDEKP